MHLHAPESQRASRHGDRDRPGWHPRVARPWQYASAMRVPRSLLTGVIAASLAGCAETGAHLTFAAPEGPRAVSSFRVVLAAKDVVPAIEAQRVEPGTLATQSVSYYLQRTVAGGRHDAIDGVDGFAVRIEPDPSMTDSQFIPFVVMYDGDAIVGMATFRARDSALPSPILVLTSEIDKYVLDVEPVVQVSDMDPVGPGQVQLVDCYRDDQSTFTSGLVWRPKAGGELRLVFPDDGGLDATNRALDLDCDAHEVSPDSSSHDCDDSRAWFHRDAEDTCDGFDTNCDGLQSMVVACTDTNTDACLDPTTSTGVALCDDRTGTQAACQSDPQCLCAATPSGCPRCVVTAEAASAPGSVTPCQPSIGYVRLEGLCADTERCPRVEVLRTSGGWKAEVSPDVQPYVFGYAAQNVGPKVILRVKRPEGPGAEIAGTFGASTGDVMLGVQTADGSTHLRAIDLQIDGDMTTCEGTGPFQMLCYP